MSTNTSRKLRAKADDFVLTIEDDEESELSASEDSSHEVLPEENATKKRKCADIDLDFDFDAAGYGRQDLGTMQEWGFDKAKDAMKTKRKKDINIEDIIKRHRSAQGTHLLIESVEEHGPEVSDEISYEWEDESEAFGNFALDDEDIGMNNI
ncbi:ATP-dependent RNA helicase drs1 [Neolecta irregularis DAH-3]|uniref:ATP-dependent RNA helicase drs1 n=1 Tax=Neolecta irregularis (strain DAH-3) TaxID=1198029 RepID=A0A1U7LV63_NEOID|nr:ATP-dependent RNA helicase drs1 [Neolecta irregularis DAH-3]|eukprot:OLL26566.1 ATP-dependent RNA helicase drs1 [Neolecta irregularis DAH-3]